MDRFEWDDKLSGFGKRIRNDRQTWIVQYRLGSQQRRLKVGSVEKLNEKDAREAARKILAKVELGHDPANEKKQSREEAKHTLRSVAAEYLKAKKPEVRVRTYDEVARYLGMVDGDSKTRARYWHGLHPRPISSLSRRDIAVELAAMANRSGPVAANRARAALSSLFSWAMREGLCEQNPTVNTNKSAESEPRDRVLSDPELAAVWRAAPDTEYGMVVRLLILTGCRREEIGGLREHEVDRDGRVIRLPKERTKNGCPHDVPLSGLAWSLLPEPDQEYLFGRGGHAGFKGWPRAKDELDKRIGDAIGKPWTLHDIRRTVATRMADLGVQPHIIEAVLNHQGGHKAGVAGIYNKSRYTDGIRAALLLWSSHVEALVEGKSAKVVPLRA
jgi:integrase